VIGGLGLGEHYADQPRQPLEEVDVVGPERGGSVVDPDPRRLVLQPRRDVVAGTRLQFGVDGVLDVEDYLVGIGLIGLVEKIDSGCVDQQPGSGDRRVDRARRRPRVVHRILSGDSLRPPHPSCDLGHISVVEYLTT